MRIVSLTLIGLSALPSVLCGQTPVSPPGIFMSAGEVAAGLDSIGLETGSAGAAVSIHQGVSVRRRAAGGPTQYAIIHRRSIEIFQIVDGSGTLVTGGTLARPLADSSATNMRSFRIDNGESRRVAVGDVVVLPPGTPHWFSELDGSVSYLQVNVRIEP